MLEVIDLRKKMDRAAYDRAFPKLQEKLRSLQYAVHQAEIPVVIALEGWDGSGRGEMIKQLSEVLDPRMFKVFRGKEPTPLEQRYHFLWRYQVVLPNDGHAALFDHSWYGRVLVERVDKIVRKSEWQQAYEQINEFERWLAEDKQVIAKFWLHISQKEQKKRFREIQKDPHTAWKITREYKRHHKQYGKWVKAVEEMLAKTDSPHAPWTIVAAEDRRTARIKVFEVLIKRIEDALARRAAAPTSVSRTAVAQKALAGARERKKRADAAMARKQAQDAGLPLEKPKTGAVVAKKKKKPAAKKKAAAKHAPPAAVAAAAAAAN